MNIRQILQHWRFPPWVARQQFDRETREHIEQAVAHSESRHRGELRVVIESHLSLFALLRGVTSRQRAERLFDELGVAQTAERSGILIYILLAERRVEIVADSGITAQVPKADWDRLCRRMTESFAAGDYAAGARRGVEGATELLVTHFPVRTHNPNELDDAPLIL